MRRVIADLDCAEPIRLAAALQTGKKVPPDVTELLAEDHRTVIGWFRWYEATPDRAVRSRLVERICVALLAHMAGEEEFLYPAIARVEAVAARRVETLLSLRSSGAPATKSKKRKAKKQEIPMLTISDADAREYFLLGLKNAHATTRQGRVLVAGQVKRVENYPQLKAKLEQHLREKDAQLERLESLLSSYDESPSVIKDTAMKAAAGVAATMSAAAADEVVKNSFATLAQAKYEAAAFETLIVFAQAAGEAQALPPLQQCLSESRGLASFVEENLRGTAVRFLQLRAEGRQAKR